jgi:hypothetical protein
MAKKTGKIFQPAQEKLAGFLAGLVAMRRDDIGTPIKKLTKKNIFEKIINYRVGPLEASQKKAPGPEWGPPLGPEWGSPLGPEWGSPLGPD